MAPSADGVPAFAGRPGRFPLSAASRAGGFSVVVKRSALNAVFCHGVSRLDAEVCGVLVGDLWRDEIGPYLYVEAAISGRHASSTVGSVTFTAETWTHVQEQLDRLYPAMKIVGWYHTHPGFGVFLSDMDVFIHGNFFDLPWQVALVRDPVSEEWGTFLWKKGEPVRSDVLIEEDEKECVLPAQHGLPLEAVTSSVPATEERETGRRQFLFLCAAGALVIALVVLVVRFAGFPGARAPHRQELPMVEKTDAQSHDALSVPAAKPALHGPAEAQGTSTTSLGIPRHNEQDTEPSPAKSDLE